MVQRLTDEQIKEITEHLSVKDLQTEYAHLVNYFRSAGSMFGREGDYENWTPMETAIHTMERFRKVLCRT